MIDFATLTLIDYGILLMLVLSCILSTLRGMTRELLGLIGWVVSYFIATYGAPIIEDSVVDFVQAKSLGQALAWGLPFATSVVVWFILASLIAPGLKRIGFGVLDRWLGVLFGVVRGFGLVLIAFAFFCLCGRRRKKPAGNNKGCPKCASLKPQRSLLGWLFTNRTQGSTDQQFVLSTTFDNWYRK